MKLEEAKEWISEILRDFGVGLIAGSITDKKKKS